MKKFHVNFPKVSIIIPTYNRANTIGRAIQSVLNQTYQNFEIVIIDDSPNDKTEKVVNGFNDSRIKYIHNKVKTNLPTARNQGVRESSPDSKYIAFLDDDDEWLPQFLEKTIAKLEEKKDVIAVGTYGQVKISSGIILRKKVNLKKEDWNTPIGNCWVVRKNLFTEENFWFDENLPHYEDLDFGIRILKNHKKEVIPEILHIHYDPVFFRGESLTTSKTFPDVITKLYQKHFDYFSTLGKKPLSSFYFLIGKAFCRRTEEVKKGKSFFIKAFFSYPNPIYLFYYCLWCFPKIARRIHRITYLSKIHQILYKINQFFKNRF